jgi:four helix bundle protein
LIAWQRADDLFIKLHQLSLKAFPTFERYELGGQLRRAAFSVAVNIVEGFSTRYPRKRLHFLDTSSSSLAEVGYCLHAAFKLGYLTAEQMQQLDVDIRQVGAPLAGLIRSERDHAMKAGSAGIT